MSARMQIMEYLAKNGLTTADELQAGIGETNRKRLLDNAAGAIVDGMMEKVRDDVTGQPAYKLTSKGAARVKNGHQMVNGRTAEQNKAACDQREAAAADLQKRRDDDAECEAIVANLAKALQEKAMLSHQFDTLKNLSEAQTTIIADLRAKLDDANKQLFAGDLPPAKPSVLGYACMADEATILPTEEAARNHAVRILGEGAVESLHVVALLASAELKVTWKEAS